MYEKLCRGLTRFLVLMVPLIPAPLLAALPTAASVADGSSTTSPLQMFRDLGTRNITIAATSISGLIVLGIAFHIYGAFVTAREKNDWKSFGITASVGVVVGAGAVMMAILAVQYGTQ